MMRSAIALTLCAIAAAASSCAPPPPPRQTTTLEPTPATLHAVDLSDSMQPIASDRPVSLTAARNEWTSFALQVSEIPQADGYWVRFHEPQFESANAAIPLSAFETYEVLPMPVDLDRAGFVRHTGLSTASRNLPRALLPAAVDPTGALNLHTLRDPARPTDPSSRLSGPHGQALLWVDLHVPPTAGAGDYGTTVDLMRAGDPKPVASVPLHLTIYDFTLPDERHLNIIGQIGWDRLKQLYADEFEAVRPRLINRTDPRYAGTVTILDQLVTLAQRHRTAVVIPNLQPTVKWDQPGQPPTIDWRDFDSLIRPWMQGTGFADHIPLSYWPLPEAELLERYDRKSQLDYWSQAAVHFDQNDWLNHTAVSLAKITPGRAGTEESIDLSAQAAEILAVHPRIRVMLPLEEDQVQLAGANNPKLIDPATTSRLLSSCPSLVFATPPKDDWPPGVAHPEHWLRTDLPGIVPYAGAGGSERDVRLWAWLAFLRRAHFIQWDSAVPAVASPTEPADPGQLVWFYPGKWFGLAEPVATVQLKWLRRAQQDYEYLWLAQERGEIINAMQMARLITKPVEIAPGQLPDPTYSLMSGTTDVKAWTDAHELLARSVLLRQPEKPVDTEAQRALYIQTLQWARPQERPLLMGRTADWSWDDSKKGGDWIKLRLGMNIYNASDDTPGGNVLHWAELPTGWEIHPQPMQIPLLKTYHVLSATMDARFDALRTTTASRQTMEIDFVDGFTKVASPLKMVLPVAASARREGRLSIDGSLEDWDPVYSVQDGPMVVMLNRPTLQRQDVQMASTSSKVFTGWADENFYLAFALEGIAGESHRTQNFVTYKDRRAWGEDLCEVMIQPVYGDASNTLGSVLHIICKPNGAQWVERKVDPRVNRNPWQPVEGSGIRYAATTPTGMKWNGELAIPWKVIADPNRGSPVLIRFNFVQHRTATGESASWCGPIDFGRDDSLMGALYLRNGSEGAGVNDIVRSSDSPYAPRIP